MKYEPQNDEKIEDITQKNTRKNRENLLSFQRDHISQSCIHF